VRAETIRFYGGPMPDTESLTITRHAEVSTVLADPRFVVPPVPGDDRVVGVGMPWLRAHVTRFSTGTVHERRRAQVVAELDLMSPAALHKRAAERASGMVCDTAARTVPVGVLAEALGITVPVTVPVTDAVALVARAYHPGTEAGPRADDAVAYLVEVCGGVPDEATAARIGLLVQACDATAGLIGNAVQATRRLRLGGPVHAILAETLRHDPPVRVMRRMSLAPARIGNTNIAAGCLVLLDLVAANRDPAVFSNPDRFDPARPEADRHLTLGAGLRPCPGRDHAFAIAAGVLEAAQDCGFGSDCRCGR
jgi:cytochrome P450